MNRIMKNVLFSSSSCSEASSSDEDAAHLSISSPSTSFIGSVQDSGFDSQRSDRHQSSRVYQANVWEEFKHASVEQVSAATRIQQMYRGHLGREILRWLVYEIDRDCENSDLSNEGYEASKSCDIEPGLQSHSHVKDVETSHTCLKSSSNGNPITCEVLIISTPKSDIEGASDVDTVLSKSYANNDRAEKEDLQGTHLSWRTILSSALLMGCGGTITVDILEARMLRHRDNNKSPNPFCRISLHHTINASAIPQISSASLSHMNAQHLLHPQHRTRKVDSCDEPVWNDSVTLNSAFSASSVQDSAGMQQERSRLGPLLSRPLSLLLTIHDDGYNKIHNLLGQVLLSDWKEGAVLERWCPLYDQHGKLQLNQMGSISAVKVRLRDERHQSQLLAELAVACERIQAGSRRMLANKMYCETLVFLSSQNQLLQPDDFESMCTHDLSARLCSTAIQELRSLRCTPQDRGLMCFVGDNLNMQNKSRAKEKSLKIAKNSRVVDTNLDHAEALATLGIELLSEDQQEQGRKYLCRSFEILNEASVARRCGSSRYRKLLTTILRTGCIDQPEKNSITKVRIKLKSIDDAAMAWKCTSPRIRLARNSSSLSQPPVIVDQDQGTTQAENPPACSPGTASNRSDQGTISGIQESPEEGERNRFGQVISKLEAPSSIIKRIPASPHASEDERASPDSGVDRLILACREFDSRSSRRTSPIHFDRPCSQDMADSNRESGGKPASTWDSSTRLFSSESTAHEGPKGPVRRSVQLSRLRLLSSNIKSTLDHARPHDAPPADAAQGAPRRGLSMPGPGGAIPQAHERARDTDGAAAGSEPRASAVSRLMYLEAALRLLDSREAVTTP